MINISYNTININEEKYIDINLFSSPLVIHKFLSKIVHSFNPNELSCQFITLEVTTDFCVSKIKDSKIFSTKFKCNKKFQKGFIKTCVYFGNIDDAMCLIDNFGSYEYSFGIFHFDLNIFAKAKNILENYEPQENISMLKTFNFAILQNGDSDSVEIIVKECYYKLNKSVIDDELENNL